ncbi:MULTISPECIES: ImmA/IrrE family metallo-endopeptidase [unclassified Enterococcus]|uniref:ImmA/IrrE family metallo-endopeptidase n=1 Tax=unclassified Enterococcus TaxID=2608891 RepID=UPI0013EB536F|nr:MULTISPECIES: ImmA/IrrE family metallo-endopeptidase [unclassified Enterococcus]
MKYINRNEELTKDEYLEITSYVLPLQTKVGEYFKLQIKDLRWHHYVKYCIEKLGYEILYYDYGDTASKFISGRTRLIDGVVSIIVNKNHTHNSGRQHFTTLHEIAHGFLHLEKGKIDKIFFSAKTIPAPGDKRSETEADVLASVMMISDKSIAEEMKTKPTFAGLCFKFECSYANLLMRLKNYLVFNLDMNKNFALKLILDYRDYDDTTICEVINHLSSFNYYYFHTNIFQGIKALDYETALIIVDTYTNYTKSIMSDKVKEIIASSVIYQTQFISA